MNLITNQYMQIYSPHSSEVHVDSPHLYALFSAYNPTQIETELIESLRTRYPQFHMPTTTTSVTLHSLIV